MSKSNSNYFVGTQGHIAFFGKTTSKFKDSRKSAEEIIAERVKGLDLNPHPIRNKKVLSYNQMKQIKDKIKNRTATMKEYKNMRMTERLKNRRNTGGDSFYEAERERILNKQQLTRDWTPEQIRDILNGRKPKENGRTIHLHHTFSVRDFPHLANKHEIMFPATFEEHLYNWHGGNWKKSIPGERIYKNKRRKK